MKKTFLSLLLLFCISAVGGLVVISESAPAFAEAGYYQVSAVAAQIQPVAIAEGVVLCLLVLAVPWLSRRYNISQYINKTVANMKVEYKSKYEVGWRRLQTTFN